VSSGRSDEVHSHAVELTDSDAYRPPSAHAATFSALLSESYQRLVGTPMADRELATADGARWLYLDAPFCLLAHNTSPDPTFVYANRAAQHRFGYSWEEFVGLPSRLSAGEPDQRERAEFMDTVRRQGYIDDYRGLRVAKSGARFWIEDATVWNLIDSDGALRGQAALIRRWTDT
jgi:PAS domain S-box-containing protein